MRGKGLLFPPAAALISFSADGDGEMSGEGAGLVEGTMMSHIKWATVRRVQGLAIFREESRGVAGAAHMASVVVRAEPEEVFKALMRTWQGPLPHLVSRAVPGHWPERREHVGVERQTPIA